MDRLDKTPVFSEENPGLMDDEDEFEPDYKRKEEDENDRAAQRNEKV